MSLHQSNLTTAQLRAVDAAHHLHPFTDTKGLNAEGARVIVRAKGVHLVGFRGQQDPRRHVGPVERQYRIWPAGDHRGGDAADARAALLQHLLQDDPLPAIDCALLAEVTPPQIEPGVLHRLGLGSRTTPSSAWSATTGPRSASPEEVGDHARQNGYHGSTIGGASLGGMKPMHAQGGLPIPGIVHIAQPYWYGEGGD